MVTVSPVRSEEEYEEALARIGELMDAEPNTPEDDELDILTGLVERYEEAQHAVGPPDAVAAIEFRMEQAGLTQRNLVPYIGSRAKVSEVLSGKRDITMAMARALHRHLGIPADALLQDPKVLLDDTLAHVEWRRFPLQPMAKLGWIDDMPDLGDRAEEVMRGLIDRAGGAKVAAAAMFRKNDHRRINAKTDEYALSAWCWEVLARANERPPEAQYLPGTVTPELLREIAGLSSSEQGPVTAARSLTKRGIAVEIVDPPSQDALGRRRAQPLGRPSGDRADAALRPDRQLLVHAATRAGACRPAYGRQRGKTRVSSTTTACGAPTRRRTIQWRGTRTAGQKDALIPPDTWEESAASFNPTPMAVIELAAQAGVHPAVVAGRVRHEENNYRLLSQFVGVGKVRRLFA